MPLQEILKTKGKQKTSQTIRQAISIRNTYFASILFFHHFIIFYVV